MNNKLIVLIGGPGTGKTTLLAALQKKEYCCYPEISRQVVQNAQKEGIDQLFLSQPLLFSKLLLQGRIQQHQSASKEPYDIVFLDRGIPDVVAYLDHIQVNYPQEFNQACLDYPYKQLFLLPPWEEIYQSDNERYENFEQATQLYDILKKTYLNLGYSVIEVPKDTVENRIQFILERIQK